MLCTVSAHDKVLAREHLTMRATYLIPRATLTLKRYKINSLIKFNNTYSLKTTPEGHLRIISAVSSRLRNRGNPVGKLTDPLHGTVQTELLTPKDQMVFNCL